MNLANAMDRYLKRKSENETTGTSRPNEKKQNQLLWDNTAIVIFRMDLLLLVIRLPI